jgi:hypothetical protein
MMTSYNFLLKGERSDNPRPANAAVMMMHDTVLQSSSLGAAV